MNKIKITIPAALCDTRIDITLSKLSEFSRSMIQKLIYQQHIRNQNNIITKPNHVVKTGDVYEITPPKNIIDEITPEPYDLNILFEDEYLIVIDKPAELIVHPGAGNHNNTLINKLAYHCKLSDIGGQNRLGTVHRLDKGVSGCIIFAKDNQTHMFLNQQFAERRIHKVYIALCHGVMHPKEQYIENYISRHKTHRQKMQTNKEQGKLAQMNIKLLETKNNLSLIECHPITGRTHQIRVQLASINLPILGDNLYSSKKAHLHFTERIALHATQITFQHPKGGIKTIKAQMPKSFTIPLRE